jgi:hypothetical protein
MKPGETWEEQGVWYICTKVYSDTDYEYAKMVPQPKQPNFKTMTDEQVWQIALKKRKSVKENG